MGLRFEGDRIQFPGGFSEYRAVVQFASSETVGISCVIQVEWVYVPSRIEISDFEFHISDLCLSVDQQQAFPHEQRVGICD